MTFSAVNPEQVVVAAPITGDRDAGPRRQRHPVRATGMNHGG